jgi:hypothetical protein
VEVIPHRFMEFSSVELEQSLIDVWNASHGILPAGKMDTPEGTTQMIIKLGARREHDPVLVPNKMSAGDMEIITREVVARHLRLTTGLQSYIPDETITRNVLAEFKRVPAFQEEIEMRASAILQEVHRQIAHPGSPWTPIEVSPAVTQEMDLLSPC